MSAQQREAINTMMRNSPLDLGGDIAEQRVILHQMLTSVPIPDDVIVTPETLGGVSVLAIEIAGQPSKGTVLYFHGGAFAMGSAEASVGLAADLSRRSRMRVVTVEYRLAPEYPFPAAREDGLAAYRALVDAEGGSASIAIAGESAGGNLALITLLGIRDASLPQPFAAVLMSPWADLAGTGLSSTTKADIDPALTASGLRIRARDYLGDRDPASAIVSPIYANLTGLPPLLIQVGSREILMDDATRLAAKAGADDVAVILDIVPEVPHVFQAFAGHLNEADEALDRAAAFLVVHSARLTRQAASLVGSG